MRPHFTSLLGGPGRLHHANPLHSLVISSLADGSAMFFSDFGVRRPPWNPMGHGYISAMDDGNPQYPPYSCSPVLAL